MLERRGLNIRAQARVVPGARCQRDRATRQTSSPAVLIRLGFVEETIYLEDIGVLVGARELVSGAAIFQNGQQTFEGIDAGGCWRPEEI